MTRANNAWAIYMENLEGLLVDLKAQDESATDPSVSKEIGKKIGALLRQLFQLSNRQNMAASSLWVRRSFQDLQTWGGRRETFFCLKEDPTDRSFMSGVMGKRGSHAIPVVTTTKAFLTMLEEA